MPVTAPEYHSQEDMKIESENLEIEIEITPRRLTKHSRVETSVLLLRGSGVVMTLVEVRCPWLTDI